MNKSYDFAKEIKKICKEIHLYRGEMKNVKDPIERLWEYNRKTIGKDLGL